MLDIGIRIPTGDSVPTVALEDAAQSAYDALGEAPDLRDPKGTQIEHHGTLGPAVPSALLK